MKLNEQEAAEQLWIRIKEHLQRRLERHRAMNDDVELGHERTALLRGQIAEIKYLLSLDKPARGTPGEQE
jgi:hypothetical protein